MSEPKPTNYRIPYKQCCYHYQKLNYICLSKQCSQHSIICSICKQQPKHIKHQIKPLKFYIEELQRKYKQRQLKQNQQINYQHKNINNKGTFLSYQQILDQLEISRYQFYQKLQSNIEKIAEEFRHLQEDVTIQIDKFKSQILEEISKRNKFQQFYQSLQRNNIENTNFLIQNYLPKSTIGKIGNLTLLDTTTENICVKVKQIKEKIILRDELQNKNDLIDNKQQSYANNKTKLDLAKLFLKPDNITFSSNNLTQTVKNSKNLCLISCPINKIPGRFTIKLLKTSSGSDFQLGIITKQQFTSFNYFLNPNNHPKILSFGTKYISSGWDQTGFTKIGQGSSLELSFKAGKEIVLRLKNRENRKTINENDKKQYFVYLVLDGNCEISLKHLV